MEEWAKYKNYFSVAFCLEVMEYCYNPLQALKNIAYFMKKDAKLYISFHFYYPVHKPHGTDMLRFTEFGAMKLLEEAGFDVHRVEMRVPNVESAALLESYDEIEGNKRDGEYGRHYTNGYLITARKA
jgi:SAM-dependent methyltransferase